MKKILVLLLALTFALCLTACETKENANGSLGSQVASSEAESENENTSSEASSIKETSSEESSSAPVKLNPKTDFKYGKYVAEYFADDNKIYTITSLFFYQDFEGLDYSSTDYYSKEKAIEKYNELGSAFNEADFEESEKKVVNGVTYYDLGFWGGIPESYEMTDTVVKIKSDGGVATFSLNQNGTLTLESSEVANRYGKIGTIFTFVEE
jgi:hypothetical protein